MSVPKASSLDAANSPRAPERVENICSPKPRMAGALGPANSRRAHANLSPWGEGGEGAIVPRRACAGDGVRWAKG